MLADRLLRLPRRVRLVVLPAALFVALSAATFSLAQIHPASPETPKSSGAIVLGDPYQGQLVFEEACGSCHGASGEGGSGGPGIAGEAISLAVAKGQIDNGGAIMPGGLVSGKAEEDVLAYLETILSSP